MSNCIFFYCTFSSNKLITLYACMCVGYNFDRHFYSPDVRSGPATGHPMKKMIVSPLNPLTLSFHALTQQLRLKSDIEDATFESWMDELPLLSSCAPILTVEEDREEESEDEVENESEDEEESKEGCVLSPDTEYAAPSVVSTTLISRSKRKRDMTFLRMSWPRVEVSDLSDDCQLLVYCIDSKRGDSDAIENVICRDRLRPFENSPSRVLLQELADYVGVEVTGSMDLIKMTLLVKLSELVVYN
jgi:hypothetical protein